MTALLLLIAAGIFALVAFRILSATRHVPDISEKLAAIEYSRCLPKDEGRAFLAAFSDGNTIALSHRFPEWPRFRDRFVAAEKDLLS